MSASEHFAESVERPRCGAKRSAVAPPLNGWQRHVVANHGCPGFVASAGSGSRLSGPLTRVIWSAESDGCSGLSVTGPKPVNPIQAAQLSSAMPLVYSNKGFCSNTIRAASASASSGSVSATAAPVGTASPGSMAFLRPGGRPRLTILASAAGGKALADFS